MSIAGETDSAPEAGVIAYCETVLPPWAIDPKLETNIQLLSARIVIETGPVPVATVAGVVADRLPETGLIVNPDTVFESVPST